jgi:hypothetical protein
MMMNEAVMETSQLRGDYSPMEHTIFAALRQVKAATSRVLLRKVYPRKAGEPFNAQIVVNKAVLSLGRKLTRYHEPYRLERRKIPKQRLIENRLIRNRTRLVK